MKITMHFTEVSNRTTDGAKTSDRKLDLEFDMEDASIVDSTKALMDVFKDKEFLNTIREYSKPKKGCNNEPMVRWDLLDDFYRKLKNVAGPWAIEHLDEHNKRIHEMVDELVYQAPYWVATDRVDEQLERFNSIHHLNLTGDDRADVAYAIKNVAFRTGFLPHG